MLTIRIPVSDEMYDEATGVFVTEEFELDLEHSLSSLSKWEAKYEKPFLGKDAKTFEETVFYVKCMAQGKKFPGGLFAQLSEKNFEEINAYIASKQSATWFRENPNQKLNGKPITAAVMYGWLVALRIPFEVQHWHLNQLLDLVKVCNDDKTPPKKRGTADASRARAELNAKRRAELGTRG